MIGYAYNNASNFIDNYYFLITMKYMRVYLHVFVFLGVNLGLQLFVGIVVNNFNEHKPDHSALLTVSQKRWQDLVERIALTRPIKQPPEPRMLYLIINNIIMMCVCAIQVLALASFVLRKQQDQVLLLQVVCQYLLQACLQYYHCC